MKKIDAMDRLTEQNSGAQCLRILLFSPSLQFFCRLLSDLSSSSSSSFLHLQKTSSGTT